MHFRSVLLGVSVTANLALLALFALRPAATSAYFRSAFQAPANPTPRARLAQPVAPPVPTVSPDQEVGFTWSAASGDLPGLVARLRAAGFPPTMIRQVVGYVVNQSFMSRRQELLRERMPEEYWRNGRTDPARNTQINTAMREMQREQEKLMKELLGADYARNEDNEWGALNQRRQFGNLPKEKVDQFQKIMADYNELNQKVHEDSMGVTLPEDRAKLALLDKERRADIERLFTPDELLEYDLRNSSAANAVRNRAGRFDLTEEEFRALYSAQKIVEDQNPRGDRAVPGLLQQRQQAVDQTFRSVLGEQRYAEFKKSSEAGADSGAQEQLSRLVTRLNLPPATTASVVAIQQDIQQRVAAVRGDRNLNLEQRTTQLEALAHEATTKLTPVLGGARGLEAYKTNGGNWLQIMVRQPAGRGAVPVD